MNKNLFFCFWIAGAIALLLYSYTQIDLSLTFSQVSIWQTFQKTFQNIGYFQRQLSTNLYVILLFLFFGLYIWTLWLIHNNKLNRKIVWRTILLISGVLLFSYNAFSYDLFNYIFDAKIVTFYHQNPYLFKPQDFPVDPMLSFMRSVHRTYPYGPTWLFFTVPLSFIGLNIFSLTFFLYKALAVGSYLLCALLLEKILSFTKSKLVLFSLAFFAFNPLVIIESLVSAHNDITMIALAIGAIYFLLKKNYLFALLFLGVSIGIKYATIFILPFFILYIGFEVLKKRIDLSIWFYSLFLAMVTAFVIISGPTVAKGAEPQPWYLLNVLPLAALLVHNRVIQTVMIAVSLGMLFYYIPFLREGVWPSNIVELKLWILGISIVAGLILGAFLKFFPLGRKLNS